MRKYKIAWKAAKHPEKADTYVIVHMPSGEVVSQHETSAEARAAIRQYESADAKRSYLKNIS